METNRRKFISKVITGGLAATLPLDVSATNPGLPVETLDAKSLLDEILKTACI